MGAAGRRFCTAGASYFNVYVGSARDPFIPFPSGGEIIRCR